MATSAKLFVAFSHTLTQSQIDGFVAQYGVPNTTNDLYEAGALLGEISTLKEVAPELQAQMSQIPATATLSDIQQLAKAIVAEAVKVGATHFYCVGEPTLSMWANLYASQFREVEYWKVRSQSFDDCDFEENPCPVGLICIQSTTERRSVDVHNPDGTVSKTAVFAHVQWREMF